MDAQRIQEAPRKATRLERAREIVREHAEEIAASAEGAAYRIPASDGTSSYVVSLSMGLCECPDFEHRGERCKHIVAAEIVRAKSGRCEGCGGRFLYRDLHEVGEDHLTYFEYDVLCTSCARDHGVL